MLSGRFKDATFISLADREMSVKKKDIDEKDAEVIHWVILSKGQKPALHKTN